MSGTSFVTQLDMTQGLAAQCVSIRVSGTSFVTRLAAADFAQCTSPCFNPRERNLLCDLARMLGHGCAISLFQSA